MRVVLDTNIVISRYISPHSTPARIFQLWQEHRFEVVVSQPLLEEYEEVFLRSHIQAIHKLSRPEVHEVLEVFQDLAAMVDHIVTVNVVAEDPDDNAIIECAMSGDASYIITGDPHLLNLKTYQGIQILSPALFLRTLV
jgi:uncharacterized protein